MRSEDLHNSETGLDHNRSVKSHTHAHTKAPCTEGSQESRGLRYSEIEKFETTKPRVCNPTSVRNLVKRVSVQVMTKNPVVILTELQSLCADEGSFHENYISLLG